MIRRTTSAKKSTDKQRKLLLIKNIIDNIRIISERMKKDFDGEKLEDDILKLFTLTYKDLNY